MKFAIDRPNCLFTRFADFRYWPNKLGKKRFNTNKSSRVSSAQYEEFRRGRASSTVKLQSIFWVRGFNHSENQISATYWSSRGCALSKIWRWRDYAWGGRAWTLGGCLRDASASNIPNQITQNGIFIVHLWFMESNSIWITAVALLLFC